MSKGQGHAKIQKNVLMTFVQGDLERILNFDQIT